MLSEVLVSGQLQGRSIVWVNILMRALHLWSSWLIAAGVARLKPTPEEPRLRDAVNVCMYSYSLSPSSAAVMLGIVFYLTNL